MSAENAVWVFLGILLLVATCGTGQIEYCYVQTRMDMLADGTTYPVYYVMGDVPWRHDVELARTSSPTEVLLAFERVCRPPVVRKVLPLPALPSESPAEAP